MGLYTLMFHGDGETASERLYEEEVRLATTAKSIAVIAAAEEQAVIVLPAGFVQARTTAQRDCWASELNELSREHGVAVVFGIDVAADEAWEVMARPRSFAFACDRGRKLLWAAAAGAPPVTSARSLLLGRHHGFVLHGSEVFQAQARKLVEAVQPEVVLVLAHGGTTRRWLPPLVTLDRTAPTIVVHSLLPGRKTTWANAARGWQSEVMASDRNLTIRRLERLPLHGATTSSMGHWGP